MSKKEMFSAAVRTKGDFAGIFEYDGETGYFYLYRIDGDAEKKVLGAIRILSQTPDFEEVDLSVKWSPSQQFTGLFIRNRLWAVFDVETTGMFGGGYDQSFPPEIPKRISSTLISDGNL